MAGEDPPSPMWRKPARLASTQALRCTASLVLGLIFVHLLLTHRDVARKASIAPLSDDTILPDEKQRPAVVQVEVLDSCPEDMPLVEEQRGILPPEELKALKTRIFNSSWLAPLGRRAGRLGAKGVTVTLNVAGIEELQRDASLADLATFFARERMDTANAWQLSLVALESCAGFQADQGVWHVQQQPQLAAAAGRDFEAAGGVSARILPYSATIFYAHVPADLQGGALWIWQENDTTTTAAPAAIVAPRENTQLTLRGDAASGTSGQNASESAPVVSLALLQYKVPTTLYAQTIDFRVETFRTEYRAKRPDPAAYQPFTEEQAAAASALVAKQLLARSRQLLGPREPRRRGGKASLGF